MTDIRVVLITGGAGAIGQATAERFLADGWAVALCGRSAESLREARTALGEERISTFQCDVTSDSAMGACVAAVLTEFGRLDSLITAAGIFRNPKAVDELTAEEFGEILDVNLVGTVNAVRAAGPHLTAPGGSIVTVGAIDGLAYWPGYAGEAVSKAGVHAYTGVAAADLGPRGIRVNAVAPGWVETILSLLTLEEEGLLGAETDFPVLGRFGKPAEIAAAIRFLAGDEASYITGVCLPVDGGHAPFLPVTRRRG